MLGRASNEAEPEITLSCRFPAQMEIKYLLPLTMYEKEKKMSRPAERKGEEWSSDAKHGPCAW